MTHRYENIVRGKQGKDEHQLSQHDTIGEEFYFWGNTV